LLNFSAKIFLKTIASVPGPEVCIFHTESVPFIHV
jgi:hypothetical protein